MGSKVVNMTPEYRKHKSTKAYRLTRQALLDQLKLNGTTGQYYLDFVETYMSFWIDDKLLIDDIAERGVVVEYYDSRGNHGIKKNESVGQKTQINAQMIRLLDAMGIKPVGQGEMEEEL